MQVRWFLIPLVAACATDPTSSSTADTAETEQDIWGQTDGAHATTKQVAWETVGANPSGRFALTSATTGYVPETTLGAIYRDTNGCLKRLINVDGETYWRNDPTMTSCGDPGFDGAVTAIAWSTTRTDIFWFQYNLFGGPARLRHLFSSGNSWVGEDLGSTATAPTTLPEIGSWADGHIDLLWRDTAGDLRRRTFDRAKKGAPGFNSFGWTPTDVAVWHNLPNADISVAEPTTSEIDVAYRDAAGHFAVLRTTNDVTFSQTSVPVIAIDDRPALASWGAGSLMAIAKRGADLSNEFHQLLRSGSTWKDTALASKHTLGTLGALVAAASPTRANRLDVLSQPGTLIYHALFQESLPGFAELANPQTSWWCWADAAGMVINYMNLHTPGWSPESTCEFVSTTDGQSCCGTNAPADCLHGGSPGDALEAYGVTWANEDILSIDQLRFQLQVRHMPVIAHEDHLKNDGGHLVTLRDVYRLGGIDYVEIADPVDSGKTWVWPYVTFLAYAGNWQVNMMFSGISWDD